MQRLSKSELGGRDGGSVRLAEVESAVNTLAWVRAKNSRQLKSALSDERTARRHAQIMVQITSEAYVIPTELDAPFVDHTVPGRCKPINFNGFGIAVWFH